jgi:hypothetical protein
VCPAQVLGPGGFDVVGRPHRRYAYRPGRNSRVDVTTGVPVCVHPYRVGMPPGRYASAGTPLPELDGPPPAPPADPDLPEELVDLEGWLVAVLRRTPSEQMFTAVARVERVASQRFPPGEVVAALRRVLSTELARR